MPVDTVFLMCPLIFVALWRGVQALSPVPSVPDRVQALVGSCVVIPCSFSPPAPHPLRMRKERVDVRLRFRGGGHLFPLRSTAFNSEDRDQVSRDFQGRASLFGQIANGDCSVKLERISQDDSRTFEIALKKGDELLWGKPSRFNLDVVDTPEAPVISGMLSATAGQRVTLNCSVSYQCPSRPPALKWSWERGAEPNTTEAAEAHTLFPQAHRPVLLSSLSFTASHQVKPRLRCEASFPGEKTVAAVRNLHVTFAPKDVKVQVQSLLVQEGGSALLMCSCKADPPASEYRWSYSQQGRTVHLHQRTHTVRVYNVTRDMRVRCSAQNLIGRGESTPTPLNIQYKPVILPMSSSCVWEELQVLCRCMVDSNPRPAVTWSINGTVPPHDFNLSVTTEPEALKATLSGHMDTPVRVICFAFNALGNDSLVLLEGGEVKTPLLWLVIPAVAICLVIFILSLLLYCCKKRTRKHVLRRHPAVYPGGLGIYQDRMPLYINCTEVTHIYTNGSYQLVYQNCTPLFVRTKQFLRRLRSLNICRTMLRIFYESVLVSSILCAVASWDSRLRIRPMARRGGERRRGAEHGGVDRGVGSGLRGGVEAQSSAVADADTAIYLEIL